MSVRASDAMSLSYVDIHLYIETENLFLSIGDPEIRVSHYHYARSPILIWSLPSFLSTGLANFWLTVDLVSAIFQVSLCKTSLDNRMSLVTLHMLRCQGLLKLVTPSRFIAIGGPVLKRLSAFLKFYQNMYTTVERGALNSTDYRIFFKNDLGIPISPMHDIPLYADEKDKIMNMVVEIPRWTNAKMEICLKETLNPIKQDVKNGKLRFVANCFPHHGYIWNYGALPQTWENPDVLDEATGCKGDNDPIDVLEIGYRVAKRGEVLKVKVLGTVALIDEGETDWKIIVIDVNDPLANQMNDINDIEKHYPGLLKATIEWFKIYKIPDGKPENQFAFNGEAKSRDFALHIIDEVHQHWQNLLKQEGPTSGIICSNVTVEGSPFKITTEAAQEVLGNESEPVEPLSVESIVDKWHYIHLK